MVVRLEEPQRAKEIVRYAIKKEGDIFDRDKLRAAVSSLNPEYEMKMIDKEGFTLCQSNEWSRDLGSQFVDDEMYKRLGIGVAVYKDGQIVGQSAWQRSWGIITIVHIRHMKFKEVLNEINPPF